MSTKTFLILLYVAILASSCADSNNNSKASAETNSDSITIAHNEPISQQGRDTTKPLDSSIKKMDRSTIEIKSISKYLDTSSAYLERSKAKCTEWSLTAESAKNILANSDPIDSQELHYYYDVFPCYFIGSLEVNGKTAAYKINAGAFSIIEFKDTSYVLGYKKTDYKRYFLLGPGIK